MKSVIFIELNNGAPVNSCVEMLSYAKEQTGSVAILMGEEGEKALDTVAAYGVTTVLLKGAYNSQEKVVYGICEYVKQEGVELVLFPSTLYCKDIAPRVAAILGAGCVTDVSTIEEKDGETLFSRAAYGGTVFEHIAINSPIKVATVRGSTFPKAEIGTAAETKTVEIDLSAVTEKVKVLEVVKEISETVNLEGAQVVIAGGRGMGSKEDFELVHKLAEVLGGVVGATRPAIEDGWVSRVHQVGQSGKSVAPKLYIACGISGAMQHISGIMDSKYIVAINKDENATIFDIADVSIVGDVKQILPLMIEEFTKRK